VDLQAKGSIPHLLFFAYQGTFAIITAALISGAIVERMRFSAYLLFIACWTLLVYSPVCHWVWGGGWLQQLGALDFAGGTVVHVNAGMAALTAAFVLGARKDYGRQALLPHNVPFVLLGAALLWFGWLGFNGGSALSAGTSAVLAFTTRCWRPAPRSPSGWARPGADRPHHRRGRGHGTSWAWSPSPPPRVSSRHGAPCSWERWPRSQLLRTCGARTKLDDSLDVAAAHGPRPGGGALTGVLASAAWGGAEGHLGAGGGSPGCRRSRGKQTWSCSSW
jgi:Amt family ammonium transporter